MTATTETRPLPTHAEWRTALNEAPGWMYQTGHMNRTAEWFEQKANAHRGNFANITRDALAQAYQSECFTGFPLDAEHNQALYNWVDDMLSPDAADEEVPVAETPASAEGTPVLTPVLTVEREVEMAFDQMGPTVWDEATQNHGEGSVEAWRAQIFEVVAYQYRNWRRGIRVRPDNSGRKQQFDRRFNRQYGTSVRYDFDYMIQQVLRHFHDRAGGAGVPFELKPIAPNSRAVRMWLGREFPDLNVPALGGNTMSYVSDTICTLARRAIDSGEYDRYVDSDPDSEEFKKALGDYSYSIGWETDLETRVLIHSALNRYLIPGSGQSVFAPLEEIDGPETMFAWFLEAHPGISAFRIAALTNGWDDFVDTLKDQGEFKNDKSLVEALRRSVRQYGFTKFTGKAPKPVLEATLEKAVESIKSVGLTPEEWGKRWSRRDVAVSYVSGRYGEENGLCSVLERATAELGIDPTRKPKHPVNFAGNGVEVVVAVETWKDDESSLRKAAMEQWGKMTPKERLAAIVKQENVFIEWNKMVASP